MQLYKHLLLTSIATALPSHRGRRGINFEDVSKYDRAPFYASLAVQIDNELTHICGAAWISGTELITAAHCLVHEKLTNKTLVVVPNTDNYSDGPWKKTLLDGDDLSHLNLKSWQINPETIPHAEYNGNHSVHNLFADIAIIRTSNAHDPWKYPIKLATAEDVARLNKHSFLTAYGMGIADWKTFEKADRLQNSQQVQWLDCKDINQHLSASYQAAGYSLNPAPGQSICTHSTHNSGVCMGDSGGPLIMDFKLYGVVSYGMMPCGIYPNVMTSVEHFLPWISRHSDYNENAEFYDKELYLGQGQQMAKKVEKLRIMELLRSRNRI